MFGKDRRLFDAVTGVGSSWLKSLLVPTLALFAALSVGAVILVLADVELLRLVGTDFGAAAFQAWSKVSGAYSSMALGAFGDLQGISETLTLAAPLILAGLAVALSFRAGLLNIGAEGQMIAGGLLAVIVGFSLDPTRLFGGAFGGLVHILIAVVAGFVGGALWGAIPGWLRARSGAHEVITTIMLNFVAINLFNYALKTSFIQDPGRDDPISKTVLDSAFLPRLFHTFDRWMDRLLPGSFDWATRSDLRLHLGFIIALLAAWGTYWLLFKSSIGFEFRAVGSNPEAARYSGMNVVWLYVAVMAISGGLAGLAGINPTLGIQHRAIPGFSSGVGFDAIALALLGRSHPVGVVFAGLLFGALRSGGQEMQAVTSVSIDLVTVVGALVVMFIAAPALVRAIFRVESEDESAIVTKGWAA